jgi:hypothetical protein
MNTIILNALLTVAQMPVDMPKDAPKTAEMRVQEQGKSGVKADCYPWFAENNYKCPSPKDK